MTLVCIGALFNWLGLADHHTKPVPAVRYIGVGLVASGAVLICMAMCFWMNSVRDDEDEVSTHNARALRAVRVSPAIGASVRVRCFIPDRPESSELTSVDSDARSTPRFRYIVSQSYFAHHPF